MRISRRLILAALIFMVMTHISCSIIPYNMAEYFPLNQGDEWTYVDGQAVEVIIAVNGTELVNGVETIKMDFKLNKSVLLRYLCYALDNEGIKSYKHFFPFEDWYVIYDKPRLFLPAEFSLGGIYEGEYSYSRHSIADDSLIFTATGNVTVSLQSLETVSVEAGTFKDCLRVSTVSNEQQSNDWTVELHDISWYAHNVGLIKHELIETFRHPVEEDYDRNGIYEIIRATVDGVDYP